MDTNVAIYLRDGDPTIVSRIAQLEAMPALSILSRIELEGGVFRDPAHARQRRAALDALVAATETIEFLKPMIAVYTRIVEQLGYSRPKAIDRMIAATAIAQRLTLITINGDDFRSIPDLKLEIWANPADQ
ncbi:PIN domain-containing protein [Sphingomonas sp. RT2P30]|uniref:PIN domain-containing protein n=1 Tax=Parasphingomonas halimpatiens TaxID=3096162 RepID=UPI002FCC2455